MVSILDLDTIQQAQLTDSDFILVTSKNLSSTGKVAVAKIKSVEYAAFVAAGGENAFLTSPQIQTLIDTNVARTFPITVTAGTGLDGTAHTLDSNTSAITINHTNTSVASVSNLGTGRVITNLSVNASGHITSMADSHLGAVYLESAGVFAGAGLSGGGTITPSSGPKYISHPTSSITNTSNSSYNVIQNLTFDNYGHVASTVPVNIPFTDSIGAIPGVTITSPSNTQVLKYNGSGWVNAGDEDNLTNNNTNELSEGSTNLYFTESRVDSALTDKVTTAKLEGISYITAPHSDTIHEFIATVATKDATHRYQGSGSSAGYKIDGVFSPFITLTPGRSYRFNQSDGSNSTHPLRFYRDAAKTTQYNTGITVSGTPGSSGANTQIDVTEATPQVLHYQCGSHAYMGGSVNTQSPTTLANFTTAELPEQTNLYYTQARFDAALGAKSTTNVSEGSNLYYTDARVLAIADSAYVQSVSIDYADSDRQYWGNSNDFSIMHSGVLNQNVLTAHNGDLRIRTEGSNDVIVEDDLYVTGNVTSYYSTSDLRLKSNLLKIENSLEKVESLTGYTFNYNNSEIKSTGLVAQDLEKVLPEAVYEMSDGYKAIRYENMMGLIVEAIKDLKHEVEVLKGKIK